MNALPKQASIQKKKCFLLTLEYDGTNFLGWQAQTGKRTVQGTIQDALKQWAGCEVLVSGASRTDAGVHARGQAASFVLSTRLNASDIRGALQSLCPLDISIRRVIEVPLHFSVRNHAQGKIYTYVILNSNIPSPLLRRTSLWVRTPLNVPLMRRAARALEGKKDFASLETSARDGKKRLYTRTHLRRIRITKNTKTGLITIEIHGKSFLYKMCRTLVGTLIQAGKKQLDPAKIPAILRSRDRALAGPAVAAHGLCLDKVIF